MKKRFLNFMVLPILLMGCGSSAHTIYVFKNLDLVQESSSFVQVDDEQIKAMYFGMHQFPLYIYQQGCSKCAEVTSFLSNYIKERKTTIYTLNAESEYFQTLKNDIPKYFYDGLATPTFYIFKKGKAQAISQTLLDDEIRLHRTLNQYLIEYKFSTVFNNCESLDNYLDRDEYLLITMDSRKTTDYLLFETIAAYPAKLSKKDTMLIFYDSVSDDIKDRLNIIFDNDYTQKAIIKKNNIMTIYDLDDIHSSFITDAYNYYIKD